MAVISFYMALCYPDAAGGARLRGALLLFD